jgi:uncharacterized membrane protein YphA (DoxX/SURF4 family)
MATSAESAAAVPVRRVAYIPTGLIIALVLLRLCAGWHFWREGTKKLAYNPATGRTTIAFSAEPMLRLAVGPLAPTIKEELPNFHDWESLLAKPWVLRPMTDKEQAELEKWERDYAARRAAAKKKGEEPPFEFPPQLPYAEWGTRVSEDWKATVDAFKQLPDMSDAQKKAADEALAARQEQLKDYLTSQAKEIGEWKNELARLRDWEAGAGAESIPFEMNRIKEKRSETAAASAPWIEQVRTIERGLNRDLRQILNAEQAKNRGITEQVDSVLADADDVRMHRINVAVTCLVIGIGVCLVLGLFTRLASLAGILFLLAVIATQPPWVAGAKTEVFYYQVVEIAGLLVLFASAAGRWAGLDFFIRALLGKCCGRKESPLK